VIDEQGPAGGTAPADADPPPARTARRRSATSTAGPDDQPAPKRTRTRTTAKAPAAREDAGPGDTEMVIRSILQSLEDDKAEDIISIDLAGNSSIADAMIVASGRSHRHVGALADHLLRKLKELGLGRLKVEGLPAGDWVLLDAGDVVIHLFRPEVRAYYGLERLWLQETRPEDRREAPSGATGGAG